MFLYELNYITSHILFITLNSSVINLQDFTTREVFTKKKKLQTILTARVQNFTILHYTLRVDIQCGLFKRPVTKLAPLPFKLGNRSANILLIGRVMQLSKMMASAVTKQV